MSSGLIFRNRLMPAPTVYPAWSSGGTLTLPIVFDMRVSPLAETRVTGTGGSATYSATGGWNNTGYVHFTMPSTADSYACFGQFGISPAVTQLNIGLLMWFHTEFINDNEANSVNPKTMVIFANTTGERPSFLSHSYDFDAWQYGVWNNVTTDWYNPSPPKGGFNLNSYLNQWLFFEVEFRLSGTVHRVWLTTADKVFNQRELHSTVSNYSQANFDLIDVIGSYGGMVGQYRIGQMWLSTSRIGPPHGF